jgi:hypothetical protein
VASWLQGALGPDRVEAFVFTGPSKSTLGFGLLAAVGTGRCRMYGADDSEDWRQVKREVEHARYELMGNEQMRFSVPASEGHDDYLMSLALVARAAVDAPPAESAVIHARPMEYNRW